MPVSMPPSKPNHLSAEYAAQFQQADVAQTYCTRPPYPNAVFDQLESLLAGSARVLELGAGTGDLTLGLAERCGTLDAVEPSTAMLNVARQRLSTRSISWHGCTAEQFAFAGLYDLVVAAESLHWMDWDVVLPRIANSLAEGGQLAIVAERKLTVPWSAELRVLIERFSTNRDYQPYDLVELLTERGLFSMTGQRTVRCAFTQSIDDYIESFHSRNGFSRERMGMDAAGAFDAGIRDILDAHGADTRIDVELVVQLVWGRP
jgi:ubiquinone/menaquinone biosynthesis C-methylase UbiE